VAPIRDPRHQAFPHTPTPKLTTAPLYHFILLNIARLLTKTKAKHKVIAEMCNQCTLFICLCETFLADGVLDSEVQIQGFSLTRSDRILREGGGACIYINSSILFDVCLKYSNYYCDLLIVKLHHPSLTIILMYRPPVCPAHEFDDIIERAKSYYMSLSSPLPNIIMLGDFNFPDTNWSNPNPSCPSAGPLINLSNQFFLNQQVTEPTRKLNILDLIFCSDNLLNTISISDTSLSDHRLIYSETCLPVPISPSKPQSKNPPVSIFDKLDFNKANWPNLALALKSINWDHVLAPVAEKDRLTFALNLVSIKCSECVPTKGKKKRRITSFHRDRKILMRRKRKIVKSPKPASYTNEAIIRIEQAITSSHHDEKLYEEQRAVNKIKSDPNYFFRYAKSYSICKTDIGPLYCNNMSLSSEPYEMCCSLIRQFNSVFTSPNPEKIVTDPESFFSCQSIAAEHAHLYMTDIVISEQTIMEAIGELSAHSAAGPDGVPSTLLINCATELMPLLITTFTHSISCGFIPTFLKRAAITPVFKSGDKALPKNYRPISLTSIIIKILERIIRKQVFSFLTEKGCLNDSQHGFRSGRSCLSALLNVFDNIMHMLSNESTVDMIYLDFSKAFDKVDHGILLHKVRDMGISGKLGIWFYHFLTNRSQHVRLPGGVSDDCPVISGVPQGTVLGPLLFIIMLADINKEITVSNLISFADDTRVYSKIDSVDDCDVLQSDLNSIYKWAEHNNMYFNAQKFDYVSFSPHVISSNANVYINSDMDIINPSRNVRDLGIYMSSDCSFDHHVAQLCNKCRNLAGWILRTFVTRDPITMLTLFKSLVLSRLDYASQLWSPHKLKDIYLIENVQRYFTKQIAGMRDLTYQERLKSLRLSSVQRRRDRYCIIYVWKIVEGLVPNFADPITCIFSDRRGRSLAMSHISTGRLGTLAYNSFRWRSVRMFNALPKAIKNLSSCTIGSFKSQLDHYLRNIEDTPCQPGYNNSLDRGDCLQGGHYDGDLVVK